VTKHKTCERKNAANEESKLSRCSGSTQKTTNNPVNDRSNTAFRIGERLYPIKKDSIKKEKKKKEKKRKGKGKRKERKKEPPRGNHKHCTNKRKKDTSSIKEPVTKKKIRLKRRERDE